MPPVTSPLVAALIGLAAVVGATVAVCLGHISEATYIALVGPIGGVGLGAGVHAQGVATTPGAGSSAGSGAGVP